MHSDGNGTDEVLCLQKVTPRPSILKIDQSVTQQQKQQKIISNEPPDTVGAKCSSLFDNPLSKFKKVNKLLKCKRFSSSMLYEKKSSAAVVAETISSSTATTLTKMPSTSTITAIPISTVTTTEYNKRDDETQRKESSKIQPMKPLKKKRAIHLSKLSLFSQKQRKQQSGISHSNHELTSKSSTKAKLSETSKSTCEISKLKSSPLRFSRKSSKSDKKPKLQHDTMGGASITPQNTCHSPLSEEFYNKTGSVRLSAIELYEKFCSEDFGGLYKHETYADEQRFSNGQHEYRLEKKGLRAIGRYHKNAKLLKQRSEPKFRYFSSHTTMDTFYHEEEEYYYDSHPEDDYYYAGQYDGGPYYNEQDEYYDEYGDEDDVDGFDGDYYEDDDHEDQICYDEDGNMQHAITTNINSMTALRAMDKDLDGEANIAGTGVTAAPSTLIPGPSRYDIIDNKHSEMSASVGGGTDSDVDEIFLMPSEDSKCSGSDYEEYGFENKQFTLEQSMLKTLDIHEINICSSNISSAKEIQGSKMKISGHDYDDKKSEDDYHTDQNKIDDVLTIYKICSKEYLNKSYGALKGTSRSSSSCSSLHKIDDEEKLMIIQVQPQHQLPLKDDKCSVSSNDNDDIDLELDKAADKGSTTNKKHRSLSLQCGESLQKVVSDYIKLSTTSSDQNIITPPSTLAVSKQQKYDKGGNASSSSSSPIMEPRAGTTATVIPGSLVTLLAATTTTIRPTTATSIKTDCLDISDKTDNSSLELLSTTNSSSGGTMRSHSTLTEYAFDTVKNLNMDSCSTNSKLSLSLKSEIFDDFTITPVDDLKPINKCDFEDFTLTPDGSVSDEKKSQSQFFGGSNNSDNDSGTDANLANVDYKRKDKVGSSEEPPPLSPLLHDQFDYELDDSVLLIVNEFLTNERNLPKAEDFDIFSSKNSGNSHNDGASGGNESNKKLEAITTCSSSTSKRKTEKLINKSKLKMKVSKDSTDNHEHFGDTSTTAIESQKQQQIEPTQNQKDLMIKVDDNNGKSFDKNIDDKDDNITERKFLTTTEVDNDDFTVINLHSSKDYDAFKSGSWTTNINYNKDDNNEDDDDDDNYDNDRYDDQEISLFTSELNKEFDRLFSKAEEIISTSTLKTINDQKDDNDNDDRNLLIKSISSGNLSERTTITNVTVTKLTVKSDNDGDDNDDSMTIKRETLPSRYSMQKLEPLEFFDDNFTTNQQKSKTTMTTKTGRNIDVSSTGKIKTHRISSSSSTQQCSKSIKKPSSSSSSLQKQNRSQSLGNLNKKTKCFPL